MCIFSIRCRTKICSSIFVSITIHNRTKIKLSNTNNINNIIISFYLIFICIPFSYKRLLNYKSILECNWNANHINMCDYYDDDDDVKIALNCWKLSLSITNTIFLMNVQRVHMYVASTIYALQFTLYVHPPLVNSLVFSYYYSIPFTIPCRFVWPTMSSHAPQ